jgi:hypothetical protein
MTDAAPVQNDSSSTSDWYETAVNNNSFYFGHCIQVQNAPTFNFFKINNKYSSRLVLEIIFFIRLHFEYLLCPLFFSGGEVVYAFVVIDIGACLGSSYVPQPSSATSFGDDYILLLQPSLRAFLPSRSTALSFHEELYSPDSKQQQRQRQLQLPFLLGLFINKPHNKATKWVPPYAPTTGRSSSIFQVSTISTVTTSQCPGFSILVEPRLFLMVTPRGGDAGSSSCVSLSHS